MTDLLRKQQQSLNSSLSSFFPTPKSRGSREQLTPHNTGSAPAPTQKYSISNDSLFNEKDFPKKPDTKNNKQHGSSSAIQSFSAPPNVAAATTITTTDNGDSWTTSGMSQAKADAVQAYLQSLPKDNSNNHNSSPADPKLLEEKLSMAAAAEPDLYSNNAVAATLNSKRTTRQHERYLRFDEVVKKNLKVKLSKNCIDLKRYPVVEGLSKELKLGKLLT